MDFLLDTNIILLYLRNEPKIIDYIDRLYNPLNAPNTAIISIVSIGELKSIALRNDWGRKRLAYMNDFLEQLLKADINAEDIFDYYAEIDTFSQGKSKTKNLPCTARNMGKNDLWIAATAAALDVPLITTDNDFQHLHQVYLDIKHVNITTIF